MATVKSVATVATMAMFRGRFKIWVKDFLKKFVDFWVSASSKNCFRFACPAEAFWRFGGMEARRFGDLEASKHGGMEAWSLDAWMHGSLELRA